MLLATLQALLGLGLLVIAGDILVRGAAALAEIFGVPALLVGLTIVAFGTSAPELFVGIDAVLRGVPTLALGNVVGSNIANALLVVGLPALVAPLTCSAPRLNRNMAAMIGASLFFIALALDGDFTLIDGVLLFGGLVAFLVWSGLRARKDPAAAKALLDFEEDIKTTRSRPLLAVFFIVLGLAGLVFGADLLVEGSVIIARGAGVSEAIIGLTLVAVGTSLPELATSLVAALRGHCDVALGNVIGSNIFNLLGIMGVTAMVGTVPVPDGFMRVDLWVMLAASLTLLPFTMRRGTVRRRAGGVLILLYSAYVAWLAFDSGTFGHMFKGGV